MTQRDKILYIISMILMGLSGLGGGMALAGFFFEKSIIQVVGVIMLVGCYLISLLIDLISRRKKKNDR